MTGPSCADCRRRDALIAALQQQLAAQEVRLRELEACLGQNASNSSTPPSANPAHAPKPVVKKKSRRRPGGSRAPRGGGGRGAGGVKHADETSWKPRGKLRWLWAAATAGVAAFVIHARRSAAGLAALLGASVPGILCSDRWGAYKCVPASRRQLCWRT